MNGGDHHVWVFSVVSASFIEKEALNLSSFLFLCGNLKEEMSK